MNCPVCNETLLISNRLEVEIDYCPKCRGIWLDRGELDKIIERSNLQSTANPFSMKSFVDNHDDDDHYKHNYQKGHNEHGYDKHGYSQKGEKDF